MYSIDPITTAIVRRADQYVEELERARDEGKLRTEEAKLLDQLEVYTADILDRYRSARSRNRESLAFTSLYDSQVAASAEDRHRALIIALMAAEVEFGGPLRLTQAQNNRLAEVFDRIGQECRAVKLLRHAALAFDRAASIYLSLGNSAKRDSCLFARSQCVRTAMKRSWTKALLTISWIVFGYGYQPYRLILWVIIQLAAFSIGLIIIRGGEQIEQSIFVCLTNYLNPIGGDDLKSLPLAAKILLVIESYSGAVSMSVFFALLVRRWFRS
ncbi:MAG TPA: hypothetical protein VFO16_11045 [Pseudonocardiaceae bacterium]|nr:hypothetical protein [Pseudonocardiaceae bacterium]